MVRMEKFSLNISKIIAVVIFLIFMVGIYQESPLKEIFFLTVAIAVSTIPEGLPAVVTTCLAIGVTKMSKKNAVIKKLHSVETLGCTSVICSDKTGTLTKNEMTVRSIWAGGKIYTVSGSGYSPEGEIQFDGKKIEAASIPDLEMTLRIGVLCNNARLSQDEKTKKWNTFGDPTEGCLVTSAWKAGLEHQATKQKYPREDEIPFDSTRKRMTSLHQIDGQKYAYVKGATEIILDFCDSIQMDGQVRPITDQDKKDILAAYEGKAREALRGLGFAYRTVNPDEAIEIDVIEQKLTFMGMQFMIDPPRDEVKVAIQECNKAGIKVKMVTGDNLITATAIAEELGLIKHGDLTHEGKDLDKMSDEDIENCAVFARVSPEHKQIIVKKHFG